MSTHLKLTTTITNKCIQHLLLILFLSLLLVQVQSNYAVYPIKHDHFQKVFMVTSTGQIFYLTFACKQRNMLSVALTTELDFDQQPRFNIYGNQINIPKMGRKHKTFFQECRVNIVVNSTNLLQIRREKESQLLFSLDQVIFKEGHHKVKVWDESIKWGLGQRFQKSFAVKEGSWTIWNRDKPWKIDYGTKDQSHQTYGHQPIYLARTKNKLFHLVYFKNTHGMLIQAKHDAEQLIFNSLGGNLHFIIVVGGQDPEPLLQQFHDFIGRSHIPPFWSLGYHQSRWGYKDAVYIKEVIEQFDVNELPLDVVWSDLEYMDKKKIFTVNEKTHPPKMLNKLFKENNLHFIPLLDVGISVDDQEAVTLGREMNIFLKDPNIPIQEYKGEVWPGAVYYLDYLHPNATHYWKIQLARLSKKLNFSGIWLDMNEPVNFRGGEQINEPYRIQKNQNINVMTINAELRHCQAKPHHLLLHKQVHSYYGHLSVLPTFQYLSAFGRPFIITRSNSVGTGYFAGHWTGDNVSSWQFLRASINGNFLFQIFGIQIVGADICGFYRSTTEELCSRWMQLGAFYPFARNHNHEQSVGQEPYQFDEMLLETSKISFKTRYALLKQFYTILIQKKGLGSFFRPLIFQFYNDQACYEQEVVETQFLLGEALMVAPIVYPNMEQREVYFPGDNIFWFQFQINIYTGRVRESSIQTYASSSIQMIQNILPAAPLIFLRSGKVLFTTLPTLRTQQLPNNFHLFVTLQEEIAVGHILSIANYNQDSHIKRCIHHGCFYYFVVTRISHSGFHLEWHFKGQDGMSEQINIDSILVVNTLTKWSFKDRIIIDKPEGIIKFEANTVENQIYSND